MKWFLPLSAILFLGVMVAWMAGSFDEKVKPDILSVKQSQPASVLFFKEQDYELLEPVPATIAAKQTAVISSRILARIEEIKVRAGDYVNKGQELVVLERSDLKSRVSQASSQIKSVDARLDEAKQSLDRSIELNKRGLLALAPLEAAQANYKSFQAQKKSAQQALVEAKTALNYASVLAPFDGLIVDRFAEPGSTAQPGMALLSLYNPSSVRVEANVREERAVHLDLGQTLKMDIPSKGLTLSAEIEELVPAGNSSSRTFLVKSQINDISGLLPGMYARLLIPAGTTKRILVPESFVAEVGQLNVVWVVQSKTKEQTVEKRLIKTGLVDEGGMVVVISGLKTGEYLVSKP
jgi:membrane fusion protein (multidrug efflux system)